ncbi:MAG: hypothetical protein GX677_10045, partial [Treponema sp.]|nr:hypothetical protein [Treponema sp.]
MKKARFILLTLTIFLANSFLYAANITWTGGGGDGDWNNAANWSTNTVPTSTDVAIIDTRYTAVTINLSSDITVGSLATYGDNACTINMGSNDIDIIDDLIVGSTWNLVTPNANYSGNLVLEASSSATINCSLLHLTTYSNTPEKINIGANVSINATKVDLGDSTTGRASGVEFSGDGSITAGEVAVVGPKTVDDMISTTAGSTVNVSVPGLTNKTWTGATSSAWTTDSNWSPNGVPTSTDDVSIPSGITYSPIISSTVSIDNLEIATGASLEINGGSLSIT